MTCGVISILALVALSASPAAWAGSKNTAPGSSPAAPEMQDDGYVAGYNIMQIEPKSIYERIGLKPGDTIISVNGHRLTDDDDPAKVLDQVTKPGKLTVEIIRNAESVTLKYDVKISAKRK